jgi:hypothetical protein
MRKQATGLRAAADLLTSDIARPIEDAGKIQGDRVRRLTDVPTARRSERAIRETLR